jgi:hypothetical protein
MLVVAPPRSINRNYNKNKNQKYYTIHTNDKNIFTLTIDDCLTCVMAFKKKNDAVFIANMIETYYVEEKEWPDVHQNGSITLPMGRLNHLVHSGIKEWNYDDIKDMCQKNSLDMMSISNIKTNNEIKFTMTHINCMADSIDFYKNRFEQLLPSHNDGWLD